MKFEYAVKHNGITYPAGAEVPLDEPKVEIPVVKDEPKAEQPKATPKKRATKK